MTSKAELVSYHMILDSLMASDLTHPMMIGEYYFNMDLGGEDEAEVAAVAACNRLITKALIRVLDEYWKPEDR